MEKTVRKRLMDRLAAFLRSSANPGVVGAPTSEIRMEDDGNVTISITVKHANSQQTTFTETYKR